MGAVARIRSNRARSRSIVAAILVVVTSTVFGAGVPQAAADPANVLVPDDVVSVALMRSDIFWGSYQFCPGGEFPTTCMVRATPTTTATAPTMGSVRFQFADEPDKTLASNLAADENYLFWIDVTGIVVRALPYDRSTSILTHKETLSTTSEVAVDSTHVYWTENDEGGSGKLFRSPKFGGGRELVHSNPEGSLRKLRADGRGSVLFLTSIPAGLCCADVLQRVTPDGAGGFTVATAGFQGIDSFTTDGGSVYFIPTLGSTAPEVRRAPIDNLAADVRLADLSDEGSPTFPAMAVNSLGVYWQEHRGTAGGPIFRLPLGGGTPEAITGNLARAGQLLVNDEHLFVRASERIYRYPVDAAARVLDLVGDAVGLEVVQALQGADHDIPLVEGKRTFVRAYGHIGSSGAGLTEITLWPPAVLHGSRGGVPLPGSPLQPVRTRRLLAQPAERTNGETTLFELPESWAHGTVTLRSNLNPSRAAAETDYANNEFEREVTFHEARGVCLDFLPVLTHAGPSTSGWNPSVARHLERAKALYPTAQFGGAFRGGNLRTIPLVNDPYNMRDGDHKNMLMMNLTVEFMFSQPPSACGDALTIRTVLVPDSDRFGLSNGVAPTIYALEADGGVAVNTPVGGVKGLAHEVGHQLGLDHVLCPMTGDDAPAGPDPAYPYNTCQIDDSNDHIGFDALTKSRIVPLAPDGTSRATEFMSYGAEPQWASDYHYNKMFRQLAPGAPAPTAVAGDGAGAGDTTSDTGTVIGGVLPPAEAAFVGAGYQAAGVTLSDARAKIARGTDPSSSYQLRTYAGDGTLLTSEPLNVGELEAEAHHGNHARLFFHVLDDNPAIARVEIVDTAGTSVGSRSAGAGLPIVAVDSPSAGDAVGDTMTIRWTGDDPDGDALSYVVRYSTDNGTTWTALSADATATELAVDMSRMPGGGQALVQVVASDGLHSATATAGPFTVATHGPQVQITTENFDLLDATHHTSVRQSELAILRAYGYDAEDGELEGSALSWHLDGPVTTTGTGRVLPVGNLPPGSYRVQLAGTDAEGRTSVAETVLEILPKAVVDGVEPVLDGSCSDAGYLADTDPLGLRYDGGAVAEARTVHAGDGLYVCFNGLPSPAPGEGADVVDVRIDRDLSGGQAPGLGDLVFRVASDGPLQTGRGNASGGIVFDAVPHGLASGVRLGDRTWSAELRIEAGSLGGWDRLARLRASHDRSNGVGASWPAGSLATVPGTWGLAAFGDVSVPPPPTPPVLGTLTGPVDPVPIGTAVPISAPFTDEGLGDTHSCTFRWGDGTALTVVDPATSPCTARHAYSTPGIYAVLVTVTDDRGQSAAGTYQYVVVYDASAGYVTGGGSIESPAGAYAADPSLTGKATFGFVARYKPGATVPDGATQFHFRNAGLDFRSTEYRWLVVAGQKAQYKGSGKIGGAGDYGFMLIANDGHASGGDAVDRLRVKIWDKPTGQVVYDNQAGSADDAAVSTAISAGSITVHTGR